MYFVPLDEDDEDGPNDPTAPEENLAGENLPGENPPTTVSAEENPTTVSADEGAEAAGAVFC